MTGYLVDDDEEFATMNDVELSDADEEVPQLVSAPKQKGNQVAQEQDSSSENENSDDEDDSEEEADDDSEEDDSEDEIPTPPPAKIKKKNGMLNGVSKKEDKHKESKQKKKKVQKQQTSGKNVNILQGGVKVEDIRVGQGAAAKPGKKVQVNSIPLEIISKCLVCGF